MRRFNKIFTFLVFLFLYIPMILLVVSSFNQGTDMAVWKGFTFSQYGELFRDRSLLRLLGNSVLVAILSSLIATILGTMAALGIHAMRGRMRRIVLGVTNIPLTNPEIVTGVALALLFAFAGTMLKINSILGFWTLLIAHVTFNLPYVILSVMPKLVQMDPDLAEAAQDLGCTWMPELAEEMSRIISQESRAVGIRSAMSPVIDVSRDPRWGRTTALLPSKAGSCSPASQAAGWI